MWNFQTRVGSLLLSLCLVATACGTDASGSPQADLASPSSASEAAAADDVQTDTSTTSTSLVEALAFQEEETLAGNQIWDDVESVSVAWTIEFDEDPSSDVIGGFTAGQGLTVRWEDSIEGDILAMFRDDQVFRAFRVGNEVFIAEEPGTEEAFGPFFFGELLNAAVAPLGTGELPAAANTFVEVEGVRSELPDIFYDLAPDVSEGQIIVGGEWTVDVAKDEPGTQYVIPEADTVLTREEVGNLDNAVLRQWYLDQAG